MATCRFLRWASSSSSAVPKPVVDRAALEDPLLVAKSLQVVMIGRVGWELVWWLEILTNLLRFNLVLFHYFRILDMANQITEDIQQYGLMTGHMHLFSDRDEKWMNRKAFWAETVSRDDLKMVFQVWASQWKTNVSVYILYIYICIQLPTIYGPRIQGKSTLRPFSTVKLILFTRWNFNDFEWFLPPTCKNSIQFWMDLLSFEFDYLSF